MLPFKNLRRSIDIVTLPLWPPPRWRHAGSVRAEARCFEPKKIPDSPDAGGPDPIRADSRSQKQKSPTDPCESPGLPSLAGSSSLVMRQHARSETYFRRGAKLNIFWTI